MAESNDARSGWTVGINGTRDEINVLAAKFDEPPSKKPKADKPHA